MNADKDKHIDFLGSEANKNDSSFKIHFLLKPNIIWDGQTMISKQLIKGLQYQYNPPQTLLVLWRQKQNLVCWKIAPSVQFMPEFGKEYEGFRCSKQTWMSNYQWLSLQVSAKTRDHPRAIPSLPNYFSKENSKLQAVVKHCSYTETSLKVFKLLELANQSFT